MSGLGHGPGAAPPLPHLQPARGRGRQEGVPLRPRPRRHAQVTQFILKQHSFTFYVHIMPKFKMFLQYLM